MSVNSILNSGLQGIQNGTAGVAKAAEAIVRSGAVDVPKDSVVQPIVDLKLYERSVQASVQVVKTADQVLGSLLDTFA